MRKREAENIEREGTEKLAAQKTRLIFSLLIKCLSELLKKSLCINKPNVSTLSCFQVGFAIWIITKQKCTTSVMSHLIFFFPFWVLLAQNTSPESLRCISGELRGKKVQFFCLLRNSTSFRSPISILASQLRG